MHRQCLPLFQLPAVNTWCWVAHLNGSKVPQVGHSYVISRWPSKLAAITFWESAAYADIRPLREGCGEFEVLLLDGLEEMQ